MSVSASSLDEDKLKILKIINEYPKISQGGIIRKMENERARDTVVSKLNDLVKDGFVTLYKSERKGKPNSYSISERGILFLSKSLYKSPLAKVDVTFYDNFWLNLARKTSSSEAEIIKTKLLEAFKDPLIQNEFVSAITNLSVTYVESMLNKVSFVGETLQDGRFILVSTMPKEWGDIIINLIEKKILKNKNEAALCLLKNGMESLYSISEQVKNEQKTNGFPNALLNFYKIDENGLQFFKPGTEEGEKIFKQFINFLLKKYPEGKINV